VGHEDHGEAEFALEFAEQKENLDLHRGVEGGGGLVGQEHLGPAAERERDHGPLAHAAGHFARVDVQPALGRGDADPLEQLQGPGAPLRVGDALVADDRLGDLVADLVDRVEGQAGFLEDHRHGPAAIGR